MAKKTLEELKRNLINLQNGIHTICINAARELALNTKAMAERNIRDSGVKDDSGDSQDYSKNEVPAYWFRGKELNNNGTVFLDSLPTITKIDKEGKEYEASYTTWGDFRAAQGLPNAFVNLSYSNEMWRGMLPGDVSVEGKRYVSRIAHTNQAGQEKMNWNYARYGNFLLNAVNMEQLSNVMLQDVTRKMTRLLEGTSFQE